MKLQQIIVGGRRTGPRLLITAGVHGDEFEPMVALRQLTQDLAAADVRGTLTLVPVVNEPAFALGRRTAEDDLDLARTCPGNPAGSITERVAAALSQLIHEADFYIDLHTGGTNLRLLPLTGYMLHTNSRVLDLQRAMAAAFNLPVIWGTTPQLEGRSLSVARDAGVPAIYAEHGGGGGFDPAVVEDYTRGCFSVMGLLGMIEGRDVQSVIRHRVEDNRTDSGHLQIRHPAPDNGLFVPQTALGRYVRKGEHLGHLCRIDDGGRIPVVAECSGIVLMLRVAPLVRRGDGLAVVLDIGEETAEEML